MNNEIFDLLIEYIEKIPYAELLKIATSFYPIYIQIEDTKLEINMDRNSIENEHILYVFGEKYASIDKSWFDNFLSKIDDRIMKFEKDMRNNLIIDIKRKISSYESYGSDM